MCGIAGVYDPNHRFEKAEDVVQKMCDLLIHRGPDAQGLQQDQTVTFGHRRLSVLDIHEGANQPMYDASTRYLLTYNGEIYNFKEIRSHLEQQGIIFKTSGDTEVILEAWAKWGVECLQKFVGMFAFALYDKKTQDLFLVRDRLGEKPLFYAYFTEKSPQSGLAFSSGLASLMACPVFEKQLNPAALQHFLSLNYTLTSQCFFKGVQKLPAAHYLHIRNGQEPQLKSYWDLAASYHSKDENITEAEACEELNALLSQSLGGQSISDVPLGAFLSGGIDSSTLVAGMTRHLQTPSQMQTFSIGFQEKSYSEIEESKQVARYLKVDHHVKTVTPDLAKNLINIVAKTDEPFADTSVIPTYYLAEFARKSVTVALSGDGGDELFLGYETYGADKLYQTFSALPRFLFKGGYALAQKILPTHFDKVSFDYKVKQFLYGSSHDYRRAHYSWREIFKPKELEKLLKAPIDPAQSAFADFNAYFDDVKGCHPLDQASYVDIKTWLVDDILVKVDRASMAHSLETRAPFLDHRLVEFAARLPVSLKLKGQEKKYILKKSQEKYLPHETLYRQKKGLNAPVSIWLNRETKALAKDAMYGGEMQHLTNASVLDKLWQEHENQQVDHGLKLFGLTCLGLWLEQWK